MPSALQFLAKHLQFQPFFFHDFQLVAQLRHFLRQRVESLRIFCEKFRIGHALLAFCDFALRLLHLLRQIFEREFLLEGKLALRLYRLL